MLFGVTHVLILTLLKKQQASSCSLTYHLPKDAFTPAPYVDECRKLILMYAKYMQENG